MAWTCALIGLTVLLAIGVAIFLVRMPGRTKSSSAQQTPASRPETGEYELLLADIRGEVERNIASRALIRDRLKSLANEQDESARGAHRRHHLQIAAYHLRDHVGLSGFDPIASLAEASRA